MTGCGTEDVEGVCAAALIGVHSHLHANSNPVHAPAPTRRLNEPKHICPKIQHDPLLRIGIRSSDVGTPSA